MSAPRWPANVPRDPAVRHTRAVKGGHGHACAAHRRREGRGAIFATKGLAYAAGYVAGYQNAMRWWRRKFARRVAS